jgi:PAS domain S-box-containing protein
VKIKNSIPEQHIFKLSIEGAADAIIVSDGTARILYANDAACRGLGYSQEELCSLYIYDVDVMVTPEQYPSLWVELKSKKIDRLRSQYRRKDERIIPVEITGNLVTYDGREFVCAFIRDISEQVRAEQIQTAVYAISDAAHASKSLGELFRTIHSSITELMPAKNNFYIALYDESSELLSFPYFVDEEDNTPAPKKLGRGLTEYVMRTGEPLLASPEVFAQLEESGEVESIGAASIDWLGVPLKVEDKVIGVLVVQSYTEGLRYSEEEKNILMFISEQVAMAITRRQAEEALQESEEMFRSMVENSQSGIAILNDSFYMVYANDELSRIMGYPRDELLKLDFRKHLHEESCQMVADRYQRRQNGEDVPSRYEFFGVRKDGEKLRLEMSATLVKDPKQGVNTLVQIRDITEQRLAEEQIKASLQEKEILLREIHHRVKNNLQIISSLLNLQSQHVVDTQALEMFKESRLRVRSMAMVHEKLYRSKDLVKVDFKEYVLSLGFHLFQVYGVAPDAVALKVDVDDVFLDINTAIPCGLLVSELISNSLKHAFPEGTTGEVRIRMRPVDEEDILLEVSDTGIGPEGDLDPKNSDSFGLQLVDMLTEQLQGELSVEQDGGTSISILFKQLENS